MIGARPDVLIEDGITAIGVVLMCFRFKPGKTTPGYRLDVVPKFCRSARLLRYRWHQILLLHADRQEAAPDHLSDQAPTADPEILCHPRPRTRCALPGRKTGLRSW